MFKEIFICICLVSFTCALIDNCAYDQFDCDNNKCLPISKHCDGVADCEDKSDEASCGSKKSGARKSEKKRTERVDDSMENVRCGFHEFDCDNHKKCVPFSRHCDGVEDCQDGSDEQSCVYTQTETSKTETTVPPKKEQTYWKEEDSDEDSGVEKNGPTNTGKFVVGLILTLLLTSLAVSLVMVWKKVNYKKHTNIAFNNPFYNREAEQDVGEECLEEGVAVNDSRK